MVIRAFGAAPIRDRAEILLGAMPPKHPEWTAQRRGIFDWLFGR